jgi:hypothetical protein
MAEDKKGFVLYADLIHTLGKMPDDKAGELFKHILSYVNDQDPVTDDLIIQLTFEPIKQQLKRDLKKYDEIKLKRSDAGKESARLKALKKKQQDKLNSTSVESVKQDSTNPTVRDTVNDNVNVNISFIDKIDLFKKKVGEDDNVIWRDNVYRMHKIQKGKLFRVVEQFTIHLAIQNNGIYNDNFSEFRRHCSNWIGTSIQNGKLSEFRTVKAIGSI